MTAPLKKATLQEIKADKAATPVPDTEIEVQFNPASLKLELANKVEGGRSKARQARQYLGKSSTTLSFDLHFDTADRGTTDQPVSVRTLTAAVERFVLPKGKGNTKQKPPKVRFHWDELVIDGIIESISIDFDLFASNGTPLRAKMGVSIKEQDAKYQLLESGPGANTADNATPPGASGSGPGTTAAKQPDSSATALAGESAADFASRMGLDPAAWRGIAAGNGGNPLSLTAGAAINFNASLSAGAGVGLSGGVEAGIGASVGAAFGLDGSASAGAGLSVSAGGSAGFALSAAGGLGAAIETVAIVQSQGAAGAARQSFGSAVPASPPAPPATTAGSSTTPIGAASTAAASRAGAAPSASALSAAAITPKPSMPSQPRTPLRLSGAPSASAQSSTSPAPAPPMADPRAQSFGFGVPLRPRAGSAADLRASASAGRIPLRSRLHLSQVPVAADPTVAPWMKLPSDPARKAADRATARRYPARPCGCGGACRHGER